MTPWYFKIVGQEKVTFVNKSDFISEIFVAII